MLVSDQLVTVTPATVAPAAFVSVTEPVPWVAPKPLPVTVTVRSAASDEGRTYGLSDREQLRVGRAEVTACRVRRGGPGCEHRRGCLGGRRVGHGVEPRPALEVRADGPVGRVVVRVRVTRAAGVVAGEAVHVRARTGRHRAVVRARGRLERLVEAVEVGVRGVDEASAPVVETDGDVGQALGLAVVGAPLVEGQAEVVDRQAPEVRRDRDGGEEVEVRRDRLARCAR